MALHRVLIVPCHAASRGGAGQHGCVRSGRVFLATDSAASACRSPPCSAPFGLQEVHDKAELVASLQAELRELRRGAGTAGAAGAADTPNGASAADVASKANGAGPAGAAGATSPAGGADSGGSAGAAATAAKSANSARLEVFGTQLQGKEVR